MDRDLFDDLTTSLKEAANIAKGRTFPSVPSRYQGRMLKASGNGPGFPKMNLPFSSG